MVWDQQGGSVLGLLISLLIIIGMTVYSVELSKQMNEGLLDNFSSQQIVNKFANNRTNDLKVYDFNFLPSVEIGTIGRNKELYKEFMNHPSFEIFDYDKDIIEVIN